MSDKLRAFVEHQAGRAYRKVGRLGRRVLGPSGTGEPPPSTGSPAAHSATSPGSPDAPGFVEPPWEPLPDTTGVACNICRWVGDGFTGRQQHCEGALCPACGSIGRDRFLHWCFTQRTDLHPALRIIECSPRLGRDYRAAMGTWFFYRTSDFDLRNHQGNLQLDLQAITLPDDSLDVMLCAHVLEHVPDTDKALAELRRVIAPGGHLVLQVPVLQGRTAPPTTPEFHEDHTPVFWRFGFDLTARLREHGFETELLCTQQLKDAVDGAANPWNDCSPEFDVPDMLDGAIAEDLVVVADRATATKLGIEPAYMFLTWDCYAPPE
ncbi:MAG: class I SAM-dependent methyltransferase [Acidimicrobiales bacterium]